MNKQVIDSAIGLSALLLILGIAGTIFLAPASPKPVVACNATSCAAQTTQYKRVSASTPTPAYIAAAEPEESQQIQQPMAPSVQQPETPESTPAPAFQPEPTAVMQMQPLPTTTIPQPQTETLQSQEDKPDSTHEQPQEQQQNNVVEQTLQPVNTIVSGVTSLLR